MGGEGGAAPSVRSNLGWLLAWLLTAVMGLLALTQASGSTPAVMFFVLQAVTPLALAPSMPIAVVAALRGRWRLAAVDVGIAMALFWLIQPVVSPPPAPEVPVGAPAFTVLGANVLFTNDRLDEAATTTLAAGADLMVITEYTDELAGWYTRDGADTTYPYRAIEPDTDRSGVALYSRYPILTSRVAPIGDQYGIVATVLVQNTVVRVIVVHPLPGVDGDAFASWQGDLEEIERVATSGGPPTIVVGDFNSSRWHPPFRQLLHHFTDAHEQAGAGWSMSWPNDRLWPPFVRLDHALLDGHLVATHVDEIDVPGSDHQAFEASISVLP